MPPQATETAPHTDLPAVVSNPKPLVAKVVEVLHACAIVEMPDGEKASLAWKEIWPKFKIHDRAADFRIIEDVYNGSNVVRADTADAEPLDAHGRSVAIGDRLLVVPCGHAFGGHDCRVSVSHARVYNDPWKKVAGWKDRDVKSFTVESITESSSTLSAGDLANLPSLASTLKQPKRAFDTWLASSLSSKTKKALASYQGQDSDLAALQQALLQDVNNIIYGASIYEEKRFSGIGLREETKTLLSDKPQGYDLKRLNRLLIEDAYPVELSKILTENYAWGSIDPGVRARVPLGRVADLLPKASWHGHQLPAPGDEIAGWFLRANVDDKEQTVTLDYANYVRSQVAIRDALDTSPATLTQQSGTRSGVNAEESISSLASRQRVRKLLLLDDDTSFLVSLSRYLMKNSGVVVLACEDDTSAKAAIDEQGAEIDLAIVDVNLGTDATKKKDHNGISVARHLRDRFPKCPLVLTTGEEIDPKHASVMQEPILMVHDIVYKPFGTDSLYRALCAVIKEPRTLSDLQGKTVDTSHSRSDAHTAEIQESLEDLMQSLSAEAAILFRVNPITDEVRIEEMVGPRDKYHERKEKLAWSPIRDAAVRDEVVFTEDAKSYSVFPKYRYLYHAYQCKSCVGIPVKTGGAAYYAYSLFAFHPDAGHFKEDQALKLARRTARETGLFLKTRNLDAEIRQMKPFELMGQAYGSMAHDLSRDLSTGFMLDEVNAKWVIGEHDAARELLATAKARLQHAQQIVRSFRDMARGQHEEVVEFNAKQAIDDTITRLRVEVMDYEASLAAMVEIGDDLKLRMRRSNLDQILTNIVLNAAQQIDRLPESFTRKGEICVAASVETDNHGVSWLIIRISDNGPGIHGGDFKRVFELHYTTKEQGCGMGLDICRKIAASVAYGKFHGTVRVRRSILLVGSSFEVCLPILQKGTN